MTDSFSFPFTAQGNPDASGNYAVLDKTGRQVTAVASLQDAINIARDLNQAYRVQGPRVP